MTLNVFDVLGREVATLVNDELPSGTYDVAWKASGLASGVYFYQLKTPFSFKTKSMMLMK